MRVNALDSEWGVNDLEAVVAVVWKLVLASRKPIPLRMVPGYREESLRIEAVVC